jgi:hypothetical protein
MKKNTFASHHNVEYFEITAVEDPHIRLATKNRRKLFFLSG